MFGFNREKPSDDPKIPDTAAFLIERLKLDSIDINKYRSYSEKMKSIDAPVNNSLAMIDWVKDGGFDAIKKSVNSWTRVKEIYDGINMGDYDEDTGREILEPMKPLVDEYMVLLEKYKIEAEKLEGNGADIPLPSEEVLMVKEKIKQLAEDFGKLPAYRVYRAYSYLDEGNKRT